MRVVIKPTAQDAVQFCADVFSQQLLTKPTSVLGLATGGTPVNLYKELIERNKKGDLSFALAKSFNLDEYLGLAGTHPQSYRYFMQQQLFDHVDIAPENTHLPDGLADDPQAFCNQYEHSIKDAGGIDLQLLGIGSNGHIGFNEPTSSLASRTRIKTLDPKTIRDNARFFSEDEHQPHLSITMGIGTILDSKHVLLLATGEGKADAIQATVEGALSAMCPASALQMHQQATIVIDEAAAAKLSLKEYYLAVEAEREKLTTF
ncbi:MAG: glucosamine-6-phosphate deaminase [Gammaproteobacteria bacterium]|nr:glucosamine-6-phosphate deaminase [Gammaproteobacteria bacterium]